VVEGNGDGESVVRCYCLLTFRWQPPITFQPPPPPNSGNTNGNAAARAAPAPAHPDLITRYKLQNKLSAEDNESQDDGGSAESSGKPGKPGKAWSADRDERQTLLQKRRDQMILEARRKMEAKIAAEKAAASK
jgi:hypothetical protein